MTNNILNANTCSRLKVQVSAVRGYSLAGRLFGGAYE